MFDRATTRAQRLLRRTAAAVLAAAFAALACSPPEPDGPAQSGSMDVTVTAGLLTARLVDAPSDRVLAEISRQADVEFVFIGGTPEVVPLTRTLESVPLEEGISALVGAGNNAYVYEGAGAARRLARVFVLARTTPALGLDTADPVALAPEVLEAIESVRRQIESRTPLVPDDPIDAERLAEIQADLERTLRQELPPDVVEQMGWEPLPPDEATR